jgi:hypothetical protein
MLVSAAFPLASPSETLRAASMGSPVAAAVESGLPLEWIRVLPETAETAETEPGREA